MTTNLRLRSVRVLLAEILNQTHVAGNGGYVADFGPFIYGRMLEEVRKDPNLAATLLREDPDA